MTAPPGAPTPPTGALNVPSGVSAPRPGALPPLRRWWLLALALLALAAGALVVGARSAGAHGFTVTPVEVIRFDERVDVTLWLSQADLLQNVLDDSTGRSAFADVAELRATGRRVPDYVLAHLKVGLDGRPATPDPRQGWPPAVLPTAADAHGAAGTAEEGPPRLPLTLRYPLPSGASRLTLTLTLYNRGEFVSLYDVTARQAASVVSRTDYVRSGQELVFDLADEALAEPAGTPKRAPVAGGAAGVSPGGAGAPGNGAGSAAGGPGAATDAAGSTPRGGGTTDGGGGATIPGPGDAAHPPGTATPLATTIRQFLYLGFTHIVPEGLDHILFVLGLFLLAPGLKPLLKQVTAFTVAHSLTLGLAMLGLVHLSGRIVEPLIALSIAVVAVENMIRRDVNPARWMIVFGFGLIHGLGFAGVLSQLGVPRGQFLPALLSFNVGVEGGQLVVLLGATLLTLPVIKREWYHRRVTVPASALIACVGLYWAVTRALGRG